MRSAPPLAAAMLLLCAGCTPPCDAPTLQDPFGYLHPEDVPRMQRWVDEWNRLTAVDVCATVSIVEGEGHRVRSLGQRSWIELGSDVTERAELFEGLCAVAATQLGLLHPTRFADGVPLSSEAFLSLCAGGPSPWEPLVEGLAPLLGTSPEARTPQGQWIHANLWAEDTLATPLQSQNPWLRREVAAYHVPDFGPSTHHVVSQGHLLSSGVFDDVLALRMQAPTGQVLNWLADDAAIPIDLGITLWPGLSTPETPVLTTVIQTPVVWSVDILAQEISRPIVLGGQATGPSTRLGDVLHVPLQTPDQGWGTFTVDLDDGSTFLDPHRRRVEGKISVLGRAVSFYRDPESAFVGGTVWDALPASLLTTRTTLELPDGAVVVPGHPTLSTAGADIWMHWPEGSRTEPLVGRLREGALTVGVLVPRRLPEGAELLELTSWEGVAMALWAYDNEFGRSQRVLWEVAFE